MQLRRFNDEGTRAFGEFLVRTKDSEAIDAEDRQHLLANDSWTSVVDAGIDDMDDSVSFKNRYEAGEYLCRKLAPLDQESLRDRGLWAWLTLFFIHQLCAEKNGRRKIGQSQRYIPDFADFQRYYRHLLYGPFHIYREHQETPERAMVVLCTPVHAPGDAVEALSSRQHLITNPTVMSAATRLYVAGEEHKRGTGRKEQGGVRRFAAVLMQFDLTYDLYQISCENLIELLPPEFDEFKS